MNNSFDHDDPKLTAFALGELDSAEAAAIETQLTHDASLRAFVDEIRQTAQLLRSEFVAEPAMELTAQQRERIEQQPIPEVISRPWAFRARTWWMGAGVAAAACVAMVFALPLLVSWPGEKKDVAISHGRADQLQSASSTGAFDEKLGFDNKKVLGGLNDDERPLAMAEDARDSAISQGDQAGKDMLKEKPGDREIVRLGVPVNRATLSAPPPVQPIPGPVAGSLPSSDFGASGRAMRPTDPKAVSADDATPAPAADQQPIIAEKVERQIKQTAREVQPDDDAATPPPPSPTGLANAREPMAKSIKAPKPPPGKSPAGGGRGVAPPSGGGFGGGGNGRTSGEAASVDQDDEAKSVHGVVAIPAELDLGEIPTNDTVKAFITLINKSDEQKTIEAARASCGCTTFEITPGTMLVPGQRMEIPIQMHGGNREMEILGKTVTFVISGQADVVVTLHAKAISFVGVDPPALDPATMPEGKFKLKAKDGKPFRIMSMQPPVITDFPKEAQAEYDLAISWEKYRQLGIDRQCMIYLDHPKCPQLFVQVNWAPEELSKMVRVRQQASQAMLRRDVPPAAIAGGGRAAPSAPAKPPGRGLGGIRDADAGAAATTVGPVDTEPSESANERGAPSTGIPEPLTTDQINSLNMPQLQAALQQVATARKYHHRGVLGERLAQEFKMLLTRIRELGGQNNENFQLIIDNPFTKPVGTDALSTFSIDVDTASYANVRRMLLDEKRLPPKDAVRIEEMINYFNYSYEPPSGDQPFSAAVEVNAAPWNPAHRLVRIGLKGREIKMDMRPATNLVFLIDVSGSMQPANRLSLVQNAVMMLVDKLNADDRIAIVTYAGQAGLELDSKFVNQENKQHILTSIGALLAGGSTNGAGGIAMAYDIAIKHFIKGGVNRVVLCTDGDFNVGVSSDAELVRLIEDKRKTGVYLSVLGFGTGNYQDAKMQQLADAGNGNHSYIDTIEEAKKVLIDQMCGTLITIAKDVKIQVEFNPAKVGMYRLIGYENRMLAAEDFNDDKKDAGEIGAGHTVTALYEIVPPGVDPGIAGPVPPVDELKYQKIPEVVPAEAGNAGREIIPSDELMTLKLRYKQPDGDESKLMQIPVNDGGGTLESASPDYRFAAAVASFGMILRESPYKGTSSLAGVLDLAAGGAGLDVNGYRHEFVGMVEHARSIMEAMKPQ